MAYYNSFAGPFVRDDVPAIAKNLAIRHLDKIGQILNPAPNSLVGGRPLLNLSYAFNYAISGTSVWSYHALNLAIHLLAGLLLFGVVRRTLLCPALRHRFGEAALPLAMTAAVLWVVHPLQTEAVTYVSERAESLAGLLYLLTLYGFIRGCASSRPHRWFVVSVMACGFGTLVKEIIVTAPLIVLLYDRTFVQGSFREAWRRHQWLYWGLMGSWFITIRLLMGIPGRGVGYGLGVGWRTYALTECRVVVQYLRLAFCPYPLIFDYGTPWAKTAGEVMPYACILIVLLVGTGIALYWRPAIGFAGAWVFLILAPTSSVVPIVFLPMAEHRMYLPLAAIITLFVTGIYASIGPKSMIIFLALAAILGLATVRRNDDYHTEIALWSDLLRKRPEYADAHVMVAISLLHLGREADAAVQFQEAEKLDPSLDASFDRIGAEMLKNGQAAEAMKYFKAALQMNPASALTHYHLGLAYVQSGMAPAAIIQFQAALRIEPDLEPARRDLSRLQAEWAKTSAK